MGSSKKHKKHKDRKHSVSNSHDNSNHNFNSIGNHSVISGERPLKLVLRVPSANSPHMSPSLHNQQDGYQSHEHHHTSSFSGLEGQSNILERPYSSSSKKMKKKKSKKKHKKHSHHHSHHHHSHHKHRSSCSHHSSKSSTALQQPTPLPSIEQQMQQQQQQQQQQIVNSSSLSMNQLQQQPQIQSQYMMDTSLVNECALNEFSQQQDQLSIEPPPPPMMQSPPPQLTPNLSILPNSSSLTNQLEIPMNTTPITSPTSNSGCVAMNNQAMINNQTVINNEPSNLNNNLYNQPPPPPPNFTTNYASSCSMANANFNPVVAPPSLSNENNFVTNLQPQPQQQPMETSSIDNNQLVDQTQLHQIQSPMQPIQLSTTISSPMTTLSIAQSIQQQLSPPPQQQQSTQIQASTTPTPHHQPQQLIRAPIGVKPLVKTQFQSLLGYLLKQLEKRDSQEFFFWPVTDLIAPGYSSIITKPMDFSKIRQKIDLNSYENLIQFRSDVKLMCDNAMTYNRPDTIYYKAARKLWHYAREKIFSRDSVLELVKLYQGVTNYELGLTCADYTDSEQINVPSYGDYSQMNEQMTPEQQAQLQFMNDQITKPNLINEEHMTPDQILQENKKVAQEAADRLSLSKPNGSHYTLLRQLDDGTTTLAIVGSSGYYQDEKYVNLESLIGKLTEGAPHLPGFKESDLNIVKPIESIPTSPFSSYLPNCDSLKANLNEKESSLLLSAYGDEVGLGYAQSLLKFANDSDYVLTMVDSLLDALTNGQHTKIMDELKANQKEDDQITKKSTTTTDVKMQNENEEIKKENDVESLEQKLDETSSLVSNLESIQNQRLSSSTLPVKPSKEEVKIANQLCNKLTNLISTYTTPANITDIKSIRKALGVQPKSEIINT